MPGCKFSGCPVYGLRSVNIRIGKYLPQFGVAMIDHIGKSGCSNAIGLWGSVWRVIHFWVRRYFVWVIGGIGRPGFQRRAEGFGARESLSA